MEPVLMAADPRVRADSGKAALRRGPVVYCLEQRDNGANLSALSVSRRLNAILSFDPALGFDVMETDGFRDAPFPGTHITPSVDYVSAAEALQSGVPFCDAAFATEADRAPASQPGDALPALYLPLDALPAPEPVRLRFIPYFAFANRGVGEMAVWVRVAR